MEKIRFRLIYNRRNVLNKQGTALIQVEASLGKRKIYFSTRVYIRPEEWDKRTSTIIHHPQAMELNAWLYEFILQLQALELDMWKRGITPTLLQLKEAVKTINQGQKKDKKSDKESKPSIFARIGRWLRELKSELKKVQWPTKKQTINNTSIVIACCAVVGAFI